MKKAIVTGATGGLGRNLVQTLLAQGWQVAACGRNAEIGKMLDTEFHAFDLSDRNQTLKAFSEADIVFHCAALSSPWGRYENFYRANVTATRNVLSAVRHHRIGKLIHVSTPSIYFDYLDQHKAPRNLRQPPLRQRLRLHQIPCRTRSHRRHRHFQRHHPSARHFRRIRHRRSAAPAPKKAFCR